MYNRFIVNMATGRQTSPQENEVVSESSGKKRKIISILSITVVGAFRTTT